MCRRAQRFVIRIGVDSELEGLVAAVQTSPITVKSKQLVVHRASVDGDDVLIAGLATPGVHCSDGGTDADGTPGPKLKRRRQLASTPRADGSADDAVSTPALTHLQASPVPLDVMDVLSRCASALRTVQWTVIGVETGRQHGSLSSAMAAPSARAPCVASWIWTTHPACTRRRAAWRPR